MSSFWFLWFLWFFQRLTGREIKNISEGGLREIKNTRVERAKRNQSSTCPLGIPSAQPQPEGGDGVRVSLRFRHGQQRDRLFDAVEVGQDGFAAVFF